MFLITLAKYLEITYALTADVTGENSAARNEEVTTSTTKSPVKIIAAGIFDFVKNGLIVREPEMSSCFACQVR
jgi:hypothetical protein